MKTAKLLDFIGNKPGAVLTYPFDSETMVFKVGGKMFALAPQDVRSLNLKCDPDEALALRAVYAAITPGYHMNKRHWNTVALDGSLPEDLVYEMIDQSYNLVFSSLPKRVQAEIQAS